MGATTKIIRIKIVVAIGTLALLSGCYNLFHPNSSIIKKSEIKFDIPLDDSSRVMFNGKYTNPEGYSYFFYDDKSVVAILGLDSLKCDTIHGIYDVINDTLKIAIYYPDGISFLHHLSGFLIYFIIKDQYTLDCQYYESMDLNDASYFIPIPPNSIYRFKSTIVKPITENSFIRDKKWLWENKKNWKQWKKEQKRLKKEEKRRKKEAERNEKEQSQTK